MLRMGHYCLSLYRPIPQVAAPVQSSPLSGSPPAGRAPAPNGKEHTPAERVLAQDANGVPTCMNRNCSHFGKPMAPSQHEGYSCKGKDARTGNAKGYCKETA
jgi:hypothetical protein